MATEIVVPTVGESVTEVTVARWLKKVGEAVALDDPLVELETDKATQELAAQAAGTLDRNRGTRRRHHQGRGNSGPHRRRPGQGRAGETHGRARAEAGRRTSGQTSRSGPSRPLRPRGP